ncbi:hypothetical protein N7456_000413 [Penicillium angulare]|uniref:Heterokaryon incompatibility domain-containing protein n=1 Tax=Penicillium angulare TaxID=116970 RepID=A0A9W9GCY3_9EURO|nr:hypothetical protein N7456_000413 [Penicillium angulare]
METLPPTIRNAIKITRALSIPYLWVDALCIAQDVEEEKARDIAKMQALYSSSALTIIAASVASVYEDFLDPRVEPEHLYKIPARIGPGLFGSMSINALKGACYDERFEPIAKRGWTLQEQLLSNRSLIFNSRTMMWRCENSVRNFGNSLYFPHDLDCGYNDNDEKYSLNLHSIFNNKNDRHSKKENALSCWLRLVTVYSLRSTTFEHDKLNALASIASHPSFSQTLGPGYFAGLWQHELARQLTWCTSRWHRTLAEGDSFTFHRPQTYRAPSWPWASLEGGVINFDFDFDSEDESPPDVICEIMSCSTEPVSPAGNPFGEIRSAQLNLRASARKAWFNPSTSNVFIIPGSITSVSTASNPDGCMVTFEEALQKHKHDFASSGLDSDLVEEDPEETYLDGTYFPNMEGTCDETGLSEPILALCVAITMRKEVNDSVGGLIHVKSEDRSTVKWKRIGVFERGRNHDFQHEPKVEICIV